MAKMNLFFIIFALMLIMPMVSAETSYTFKQNDAVTIGVPCSDAINNPCTFEVNCTLDMQYDNAMTRIIANAPMEVADGWANYSISQGTLSLIGIGSGNARCTDGNNSGFSTFDWEVTPSGFINTSWIYIIFLVVLSGIIILGFSISEAWFVVLGGMGFIMLGLYSINYGIVGFKDMFMTWTISLFEIGVGTILALGSAFQKIESGD